MLRSLKSPETYFQAAFRVQSPWSTGAGRHVECARRPCYVFEFDPNRALSLVAEYGMRLAATGDDDPAASHRRAPQLPADLRLLRRAMTPARRRRRARLGDRRRSAPPHCRRWNSPLLVNVNEHTLGALLEHPDLLEALEQIEDFRNLANNAEQVVTSTKMLKKAKREQGGKLDAEQKKEQTETAKQRKEIREKLQKFLAKIPVFMYVTDFREEALKDIIESLDTDLFERVTGLTVEDFKLLNEIGVFNAQHMNAAIYQFRSFESASLHYASEIKFDPEDYRVGLWNHSVNKDELPTIDPADA